MNADKLAIRQRIRALRDAMPAEQQVVWTQRICAKALALPAYQSASTIHIFLCFQSEVDTRVIVDDAFTLGKRVVVPVFLKNSDETLCTQINSLDDSEFDFGRWNMRTPKVVQPVALEEIDLVFAPMVAFSPLPFRGGASGPPRGHGGGVARIGYGAGYYDRFLARLSADVPKIGLAFSMQQVESIPVEPHDVLLDDVLTEV